MKYFIPLFIFLGAMLSSCSSIKSGRYVYWEKNLALEQLKQKYPNAEITDNSAPGTWVFVRENTGIIPGYFSQTNHSLVETGKFTWPVPSHQAVSSYFGPRRRNFHEGIDVAAPTGTPFVAVADGNVVYASNRVRGYGNLIVINHDNDVQTVYAHAHRMKVKKGDRVTRGQVIGLIGKTGRASGPHLHFELRVAEKAVNPLAFFKNHQQYLADND